MKNFDQLRISAQPNYMMDEVDFYIHSDRAFCSLIEMKEKEASELPTDFQSVSLRREMVQRLFDQLWNLGYRPLNNKYGDEVLKTMSNHLADMRKIAFKFLKLEVKE
jgi:hypothetical protein